jgi:hypothetical protein
MLSAWVFNRAVSRFILEISAAAPPVTRSAWLYAARAYHFFRRLILRQTKRKLSITR